MSDKQKKNRLSSWLYLILLLALSLRLYGINWDQGYHLHPDERMLIIVAERIKFFTNLNPDFFNYGSLPVYILKGVSDTISLFSRTDVANYNGMLGIGRMLSAFFDVLTIVFIYKISRVLFKQKSIALASSFFYTIAFFPIQNAHFFIVDPLLTMFIMATLYHLLRYIKQSTHVRLLAIAIFSAAAITTKFTGILLLPIIGLGLILSFAHNKRARLNLAPTILIRGVLFTFSFLVFTFLFMPFGFINYQQFIKEISLQLKMNSDPYIFPYTLQYVGTTPYWYYLKNIFYWGLGPIISLLVLIGLIPFIQSCRLFIKRVILRKWSTINSQQLLVLLVSSYFILHFGIIGKSAVKFMRYMLPLYPLFAIMAGLGMYYILGIKYKALRNITTTSIVIGIIVWTSMFMSIYQQPHTRIQASEWIYQNIPTGATIAVEHWDDRLPLPTMMYNILELELYNPDTTQKWLKIDSQLDMSDYIIVASNRLYIPISKLTDCTIHPKYRCYPITAQYYKDLFSGNRGFDKVAEFTSYPRLEAGSWRLEIRDEGADESFTVYDHPKVMIFKKK